MRTVDSAKSNERWVFSPIRESYALNITSTEIDQATKAQRTPFLNLTVSDKGVEASYSVEKGYDFAKRYKANFNEDNSLYLQQITDNRVGEATFAIVLIVEGKIQRDGIVTIDQLKMEIAHIAESIQNNEMIKMIVREFGCKSVVDWSVLESISIDEKSITQLTAPLTDTLKTHFDEELGELRYALKALKKKPIEKSKIAVIVMAVIFMGFYVFEPTEVQEVVVKNDPFKKYREFLTKSLPQVGNRMAQAYNIQVLIEKLPGWDLTKVIHSKTQSPQFYLSKTSQGSFRQLEIFAQSNGLVLLQDKKGTILTTNGANVPVFGKNNPIEVYQISVVYQLLADALSTMMLTTNIQLIDYRKLDSTQNKWTTMRAIVDFKIITKEDILKIRAITKYLPITLETGAYQVSKGRMSGSLILQIHGEEI